MHPRSLVHFTELEESACDGKTQFRAEREQPETAAIHVANTMMTPCHMSRFMPTLALKSPSNMILSSCKILLRVEYNLCHKSDLSHHQMSLKFENKHSQR